MKPSPPFLGIALLISSLSDASAAPLSGTKSVGPVGADYASLTAAIADLQSGSLGGPVVLELQATYASTVENFPLIIPLLPGTSSVNTLTIRPAIGATALTIASTTTQVTISLDGARFVTIDGRPGGVGSNAGSGGGAASQLTIQNTSELGAALLLANEAIDNTLRYTACKSTGWTIAFDYTWGDKGNDHNTIDHCDIGDDLVFQEVGIYSEGSCSDTGNTERCNSDNIISNCNIFNFSTHQDGLSAEGVWLSDGTTTWTITGNSFYQTQPTISSTTYTRMAAIKIDAGDNYTITDNYIGGSAPNSGGLPWSTLNTSSDSSFQGISLNVGNTKPSSVQGNTIQNITWSGNITSGYPWPGEWCAICAAGLVNIGTVKGNVIGSSTGTGSISITTLGHGSAYGIACGYGSTSPSVAISNNSIGSVAVQGSDPGFEASFTGILITSGPQAITVSNNSVDNVNAGPRLTGIMSEGRRANIFGNTIANLNNNYAGTSSERLVRGIYVPATSSGSGSVVNNTVHHLFTGNANATSTNTVSIVGITATSKNLSQNTVYSLISTETTAASVTGIYAGEGKISRNLVYDLEASPVNFQATLNGLHCASGVCTAQNNMICVGHKADGTSTAGSGAVRGIYDAGVTETRSFYHNTVYVGGTRTGGPLSCAAIFTTGSGNVRNFQNNIFVNARSNACGTGKNYAILYSGSITGITIGHNIYFVSGTGGMLGRYNGIDRPTLSAWQAATGQDSMSMAVDPLFIDPINANLHLRTYNSAEGRGILIAGISDDFDGQTRSTLTAVDIGADAGNFVIHPTFSGFTLQAQSNNSASISLSDLLTRAADADGGTPTISAVSATSSNGGNVVLGSTDVTYTPPPNFTGLDLFTLTIVDGQGGQVAGTVTVNVSANGASPTSEPQAGFQPNGTVALLFTAIPGQTYLVQRSTNLQSWTLLEPRTASPDGTLPFQDASPPIGRAFYRLSLP